MVNKLDWHDLRHYAQEFYRARAGYIPPVMPLDYDWIGELLITFRYSGYGHYLSKRVHYHFMHVDFKTVCWDCMYHYGLKQDMQKDWIIVFDSVLLDYDVCELCGKLGIEASLPF